MGLLNASPHELFASETKKYATDKLLLGPRKVPVTRLALGSGTDGVGGSSNQTRKLRDQGFADLLKAGYGLGITFFDTADQYGTHKNVGMALQQGVPRDKVTILSNTDASTEREMREDLDRFRKELGTDYIDILLLHCMLDDDWPERKKGAMAVLSEAREKGIVNTHGTSCHTLGALSRRGFALGGSGFSADQPRPRLHGCAARGGAGRARPDESLGQGRHWNENLRRRQTAEQDRRESSVRSGSPSG